VPHFNHLAGVGFQIPRFLALVVVPSDPNGYAVCDQESMRFGTAAYWLSLANQEIRATRDVDPKSVNVLVPQRNSLSVRALSALLIGDLGGATND
jgi:hypothetical protein